MTSGRAALVDSHAHLDMPDFDADRDQVLERARDSGVAAVLCPAELTEPRSLATLLALRDRHAEVSVAAGVHPHQARLLRPEHLLKTRELAAGGAICAVGEIGLDFHYNLSPPEAQRDAFRSQVLLARDLGLPIIVHTRNAGQEVVEIMEEAGFEGRGVLHCYTEDWSLARRVLDKGFFISFTGILTFPKADDIREVARKVPLDRLMVETDSPFLVPVPWRGKQKRNEPSLAVDVAKVLAEVQKVSLEALAEATTANFASLFSV
jgi:TatD DNase family protein